MSVVLLIVVLDQLHPCSIVRRPQSRSHLRPWGRRRITGHTSGRHREARVKLGVGCRSCRVKLLIFSLKHDAAHRSSLPADPRLSSISCRSDLQRAANPCEQEVLQCRGKGRSEGSGESGPQHRSRRTEDGDVCWVRCICGGQSAVGCWLLAAGGPSGKSEPSAA